MLKERRSTIYPIHLSELWRLRGYPRDTHSQYALFWVKRLQKQIRLSQKKLRRIIPRFKLEHENSCQMLGLLEGRALPLTLATVGTLPTTTQLSPRSGNSNSFSLFFQRKKKGTRHLEILKAIVLIEKKKALNTFLKKKIWQGMKTQVAELHVLEVLQIDVH